MLPRGSKLARTPLKRPSKGIQRTAIKKPTQKKIKPKAWKFVKTHLQECDSAFSREILARDGHCMYPNCHATENLTNSHYIGRANWNTRFDPDNCIALCIRHHFMDRVTAYEFQKARIPLQAWDGQYTIRMVDLLGTTRWNALLERAEGKLSRKEAILEAQRKYNLRQPPEELSTPQD